MKVIKWLSVVFGVYVAFVVIFESVYLGYFQPSFEESGIPMLLLTTTDADGETNDRMLARFETDGKIYLSAHHWPRGWYHRARNNPAVQAEVDDITAAYSGAHKRRRIRAGRCRSSTATAGAILNGFSTPRDILRLDPTLE